MWAGSGFEVIGDGDGGQEKSIEGLDRLDIKGWIYSKTRRLDTMRMDKIGV